jgi:type I restriction enzyme S subunit
VFTTKGINVFFVKYLNYYRAKFSKYSTGTSQKVLSFNEFKNVFFKLPTLAEQQKIAQVLTAADSEIEILQQKLAKLQQEKQALMQQLLTGKRRVKVDVNNKE